MFKNQSQRNQATLVHCSAGIGRTGTLIAIYNAVESIMYSRKTGTEASISIFGIVRRLREQRWNMVKNQL